METPKVLYKYRSLDLNTLAILNSGKVWFSGRKQLNDPFDFFPDFQIDVSECEIDKFLEAAGAGSYVGALKKMGDASFDLTAKSSLVVDTFFAQMDELGVFCASSDPSNELMWAHYGDNHNGVCIGFEVPVIEPSEETIHQIPRPVVYAGRGKILLSEVLKDELEGPGTMAFANKLVNEAYLTKSPAWSYEKEWRYISIVQQGLLELNSKIVSVTYGLRCNVEQRSVVERFLPKNISRLQIKMSYSELIVEPAST